MPAALDLQLVSDVGQAVSLLEPLRVRILWHCRDALSATELGGRLGLPRQRVNYHVRELALAGLLKRAGRRRKRNMFEQLYVASAKTYVLSPELLGAVQADWRAVADLSSAAYLLALSAQMQTDLALAVSASTSAGPRPAVFSIKSQFRFDSPEQQERFTRELKDAIVSVVAHQTSPDRTGSGKPARAAVYRLILGCYPYTPEPRDAKQKEP
jgi:DNA-binding transcriptional ArsR family regulator